MFDERIGIYPQLPEGVRDAVMSGDRDDPFPDGYPPFTLQYAYEVVNSRGEATDTVLWTTYPASVDAFPQDGDIVEIHGVPLRVSNVETSAENWPDGSDATFCDATVSMP